MVKKKEVGTYVPGDRRFAGYGFPVHEEDYKALRDGEMLSTNLLDYLIQHGSPPPSASSIAPAMLSTSQSSLFIFVGGLSNMEFTIQQCNELVATPFLAKHNAKKVTKIRASLKVYTNATLNAASKLVAPMIYGNQFFVLVINCSGISRGFCKSVHQCYDSIDTGPTRTRREVQGGRPEGKDFLEVYHRFQVDCVVCGNSHRFSPRFPYSAPKNIDFCACPKQRNGIDCGLFAVAVVLHIIDGIPVTVDTFSQEIITALSNNLTSHLANVKSFRKYTLPSGIVRGVFDALSAMNDMNPHSSDPDIEGSDPDDDDVEVVKVVKTKADTHAA